MIAAGDDPRIKAAIFNMPFTSGAKDATSFPRGGLEAALRDRELNTSASKVHRTYIPVWDDSLEQAKSEAGLNSTGETAWLHGEGLYAFITGGIARSRTAGTRWENRITVQSLYHIHRVQPEDHIHKITAPRSFLYMAAATDMLTGELENHKRVFAKSKNPNARFLETGKDHADNYFGNWEHSVQAQLRYLTEFL